MYAGVDTVVQILCKQVHTGAHRHSYTKLRQLRRGVKWGSPFREEEDTRTPTRTIWCIGVQYIHGYAQTMHKRFSSRLARMCTFMHIVVQSLQRRFYLQRPHHRPHTLRPRPLLIWANDPSTSACWVGWEGSPLS